MRFSLVLVDGDQANKDDFKRPIGQGNHHSISQ